MSNTIHPVEKRIFAIALTVSALSLSLIAFAAYKLGISVPSCVTVVKPFEQGKLIQHGPLRYELHLLAKMWSFEPGEISLPTGSTVDIYLNSKDVNHGLHIQGTNVNLMAVPGVVNYAQVKFNKAGHYSIVCHEYCGASHQNMAGAIDVKDNLVVTQVTDTPPLSPQQLAGQKLLETKGCIACHNLTGQGGGIGPTFKGLWGRVENLADGTQITIDEAYIKDSILTPNKAVVKGFAPGMMPVLPVTPAELDQIVNYLKNLK